MTQAEHKLLLFIDRYQRTNGWSPSYDDMREHQGLASKSGVFRLVESLCRQGYLAKRNHKARALMVQKMPGDDSLRVLAERMVIAWHAWNDPEGRSAFEGALRDVEAAIGYQREETKCA